MNETEMKPEQEEASSSADSAQIQTSVEQDFSDVIAHPSFAHFAKGKRGNIEDICREFASISAASEKENSASLAAKMTPCTGYATPDLALTERQRTIARAAGMTYREYYTMICDIPKK